MSFLVLVSFIWNERDTGGHQMAVGGGGVFYLFINAVRNIFLWLRTMVVKHGVVWGPEMRWWEILDWFQ